MAGAYEYDESLDGRTECIFVIEIRPLYFYVASDADIGFMFGWWYWCDERSSVEFKLLCVS